MSLQRMCVIKGRPISAIHAGEPTPHYQVLLNSRGVSFRIAINSRSFDGSDVQYIRKDLTESEFVKSIKSLVMQDGLYTYDELLRKHKNYLKFAPDYIRSKLIGIDDIFTDVKFSSPGENNDLNEFYDAFFYSLKAYGQARVYVFGQVWGPDTTVDEYFGFLPGAGIHDIHLNQGNPKNSDHADDNGVFQDGMVLIEIPEKKVGGTVVQNEKWEGIFLKFKTQTLDTADDTGHPKS